jgi:cytoskeleton protein RodZ
MTDAVLTGVGQELSAAREARGLALTDVAQSLKFAPRQLEALEQERFEALPGATFAKGMVRSYARLLKLDPDPLLERVAGRSQAPDANTLAARYHQPVPFSDNGRRSTFVYLGLSLFVLVIVGAVAYEWQQERTLAAKGKASKATTVAKKAPTPAPTPVVQRTEPVRAPIAPVVPAVTAAPATVSPATVVPEKLAPVGRYRLVVRTEGEAWIEIKDSADRMLVSSLNPAGAERVVRGRPPYALVIGNPANVHVLYDDKPIDLAPHVKAGVARLTVP